MTPPSQRPILLVSEGISFCHVARPIVIGRWLEELGRPIVAACTEQSRPFFEAEGYDTVPIEVADPTAIYQRLGRGSYIYEEEDLVRYYERDQALLEEVRPALVVADFRFTILHLAPRSGIPTVGISSASCHPSFPLDGTVANPFVRPSFMPPQVLDALQKTPLGRATQQLVLKSVSKRYRAASRRSGLEPLGSFFDYASQGDLCLLCDHPEVMPLPTLRPQDLYAGALVWSRDEELPANLRELDGARKTVYVTVGTQESLETNFLDELIPGLLARDLNVVVSKGKRQFEVSCEHENLFVVDFIDETKLFPMVDLYIHHGSAMSTYQGLHFGVPMIAIPSQVDQHYHSEALLRLGTGRLVRPLQLRVPSLVELAVSLLEDEQVRRSCREVREKVRSHSGRAAALERIGAMLEAPSA